MKKLTVLLCLVFIFFLPGCDLKKNNAPNPEPNQWLISYEKLTNPSITAAVLDILLDNQVVFNDKLLQNATLYPVNVYRIIYKTTYKGNIKEVSGACVIPDTETPVPILSYQHGTIFQDRDAPSQYENIFNMPIEMALNLVFSSCGFVCAAPDYIGYAKDSGTFHPYLHAASTTTACIDMLKAVKELCTELDVALTGEYYLTGYSEGGYATLALQKEIEQNYAAEFPLTAVSAGAGAYDLRGTLDIFLSQPVLQHPPYVCFLLTAYNHVYDWARDLDEMFQSPYSERLQNGLLEGDYSYSSINNQLTGVVADLFQPAFLAELVGDGELELKQALQDNSLHQGWVPKAPLRLYHGTADTTVPPHNSEIAANNFIIAGATDIEYISFPYFSHDTAILPWIKQTVQWFLGQ